MIAFGSRLFRAICWLLAGMAMAGLGFIAVVVVEGGGLPHAAAMIAFYLSPFPRLAGGLLRWAGDPSWRVVRGGYHAHPREIFWALAAGAWILLSLLAGLARAVWVLMRHKPEAKVERGAVIIVAPRRARMRWLSQLKKVERLKQQWRQERE